MLKTILSPLTTATSAGVFIRYLTTIVSSVLTIISIIGWLTPEQVQEIIEKVRLITAQLPELLTAVSGLVLIVVTSYATLTKSSSDKAAEVAKKIDKQIPAESRVVVKAPDTDVPPIVVTPK